MSPTTRTGRTAVRNGSATAGPPPRRAGRARREAEPAAGVTPRRRRRLWLWTLGVLSAVVLVVGLVAFSPLLAVEAVEVVGVAPDRVATVRDAAGIEVGDSIVAFLTGSAAARVEALPWVAEAKVVRDLPHAVRIEVVPRIPVGWTTAGTRVLVIDADSRVLEKLDAPPTGVPELGGVADVAPVGAEIRPRSLAAAAGALGPELRLRIASVSLEDGGITAQVSGGPQIRFGTPQAISTKARVAGAVLASLADTPVTYVDVSVPAAPVSG